MNDELNNLRNKLFMTEKQRDRYLDNWSRLKEFVELKVEINPSNHQYKKVLNVIKEIENENTRKEEL